MTKKIIFMGTPQFSVPILEGLIKHYEISLVVSQPDKPVGRKRVLTSPPVAQFAKENDLALIQPEKINDDKTFNIIKQHAPDLIVTAAYGQILPKRLLELPEFGAINVHASLLPKHRGGAPIHRAIINGDENSGITIMYMAEGLDSGNIISQQKEKIDISDDTGKLHDRLSVLGKDLLLQTIPDIFNRTNKSIEQDHSLATYSPNITKEDERINFNRSNIDVYNQIRGLSPWPGAYAHFKDKRLKIYEANLCQQSYDGHVGEIVKVTSDGLIILCSNHSAIEITDIQLAGKKRQLVKDFIQGRQDLVGTILK